MVTMKCPEFCASQIHVHAVWILAAPRHDKDARRVLSCPYAMFLKENAPLTVGFSGSHETQLLSTRSARRSNKEMGLASKLQAGQGGGGNPYGGPPPPAAAGGAPPTAPPMPGGAVPGAGACCRLPACMQWTCRTGSKHHLICTQVPTPVPTRHHRVVWPLTHRLVRQQLRRRTQDRAHHPQPRPTQAPTPRREAHRKLQLLTPTRASSNHTVRRHGGLTTGAAALGLPRTCQAVAPAQLPTACRCSTRRRQATLPWCSRWSAVPRSRTNVGRTRTVPRTDAATSAATSADAPPNGRHAWSTDAPTAARRGTYGR